MCQPEDPELLIRPRGCPEPSLTLISRLCADELVNWPLEQSLAGAQRPALSAVLERLCARWAEAGPSIAAEAHCWSTATSPTRRSGRTSRAGRGGGPRPRRARALTGEVNMVYYPLAKWPETAPGRRNTRARTTHTRRTAPARSDDHHRRMLRRGIAARHREPSPLHLPPRMTSRNRAREQLHHGSSDARSTRNRPQPG